MDKKTLLIILGVFLIISTPQVFSALETGVSSYMRFEQNLTNENKINNGTFSGTVAYVTGANGTGYGVQCESGEYLTVSDLNNTFDFNGTDFTISFWVKINTGEGYAGVMARTRTDATPRYLFGNGIQSGTGAVYMDDNGSGWDIQSGVNGMTGYLNGVWRHFIVKRNDTTFYYYNNGVHAVNSTDATDFTDASGDLSFCSAQNTAGKFLEVDEFIVWKRALSTAEINQLWTQNGTLNLSTAGSIVNNITFFNQTPNDITITSLFNGNVNFIYNITDRTGMNNSVMQYKINTSNTCYGYLNGSCTFVNNSYYNVTSTTNTTQLFTFTLGENSIYQSNNYLGFTYFNQTHNKYNLTTINELYFMQVINMSNKTNINYFEIMAKSSNNTNILYCNNSYSTGNPETDSNCVQIYSGVLNFNHSHNQYSNHTLIPFNINNTGFIGNVRVTDTSSFILKPQVNGVNLEVFYITNDTGRAGTFKTSSNNGNTFTQRNNTVDFHIHQFTNTDVFIHKGCRNVSNNYECTSEQTDNISQSIFYPNPVDIIQPNSSTYNQFINISYTILNHPNTPTVNNSYVNITLFNSTNNKVAFLRNNLLNTSYYWNTYDYNLTPGIDYYLQFNITDTYNQTTSSISELFNFSSNAYVNISLYKNSTPSITIQNFTVNITNQQTGISQFYNVTNYTLFFYNITKGNTYSMFFNAPGYAYGYYNYTTNNTYNKLNFSIYGFNSVLVNVFDEATGSRINFQNSTVTLTGSLYQYAITNSTGLHYFENLYADTYSVAIVSANYAQRDYSITVGNYSTQILDAYLNSGNYSVIFTMNDFNTGEVLEGVTISMYGYINGTLGLIESKITDISGKSQFNFRPSTPYNFLSVKTGYQDLSFTLNPILFTSYNIKMTQLNNIPDYYNDVNVYYSPKEYTYRDNKNFSISYQSVNGLLTSYGFRVSSNCFNLTDSGVSATGDRYVKSYYVNCSGNVNVNYYYELSNGEFYNYTDVYTINNAPQVTNTLISNRDQTFGLGDFERVLVATGVTITIGGVASILGGAIVGLLLGMFVMGYLGFIGFVSFYIIGIFVVIATIVIISRIREG